MSLLTDFRLWWFRKNTRVTDPDNKALAYYLILSWYNTQKEKKLKTKIVFKENSIIGYTKMGLSNKGKLRAYQKGDEVFWSKDIESPKFRPE